MIAVILGAALYAYRIQKTLQLPQKEMQTQPNLKQSPSPTLTPTPKPAKLFHGKDTYSISHGNLYKGPDIHQVTLDPLDPAVGARQIITVNMRHVYDVTKAYLTIGTDSKSTILPLTLVSGTAQNGNWQATWTIPETYNYNYIVTVFAQSKYDQASIPLEIRKRI